MCTISDSLSGEGAKHQVLGVGGVSAGCAGGFCDPPKERSGEQEDAHPCASSSGLVEGGWHWAKAVISSVSVAGNLDKFWRRGKGCWRRSWGLGALVRPQQVVTQRLGFVGMGMTGTMLSRVTQVDGVTQRGLAWSDAPSLELFKARLNRALPILVKVSLPHGGGSGTVS